MVSDFACSGRLSVITSPWWTSSAASFMSKRPGALRRGVSAVSLETWVTSVMDSVFAAAPVLGVSCLKLDPICVWEEAIYVQRFGGGAYYFKHRILLGGY